MISLISYPLLIEWLIWFVNMLSIKVHEWVVIRLGLSINGCNPRPYIQSKKRFVPLCVSYFMRSILKSLQINIDLRGTTSVNICSRLSQNRSTLHLTQVFCRHNSQLYFCVFLSPILPWHIQTIALPPYILLLVLHNWICDAHIMLHPLLFSWRW